MVSNRISSWVSWMAGVIDAGAASVGATVLARQERDNSQGPAGWRAPLLLLAARSCTIIIRGLDYRMFPLAEEAMKTLANFRSTGLPPPRAAMTTELAETSG